MAGEAIFACSGVAHGGAPISGATHGRISVNTQFKVDRGGASWPGAKDCQVTDREVVFEVYGLKYSALMALLGATAATLAFSIIGSAGAAETVSVAAAYFTEIINGVEAPEKDAGGKLPVCGVRGYANFTTGQDFDDVITAA
ncbi:MAG: hypothetical protein ACE15C_14485 [Phycisphaerae bacterium]